MQRSFSSHALVLRVRSSGESNREAFFLSAEEGVFSATLFGGPRSSLRSHVSPFNSGLLWTYRDPAKDFRKVSDFDVQSWRPGLRELYERSNTAFKIAGTILSAHGGGGAFAEAFVLANAILDALDNANEAFCERLFIYFIWNWAGLQGNRGADMQHCASCTCEWSNDALIWFIPGEGFLCKNCIRQEQAADKNAIIGPGARQWLLAVERKNPSELSRMSPDASSLRELKMLIKILEH